MESVGWVGVLIAGSVAFLFGGLWYSPLLFGKKWWSLIAPNGPTVQTRPPPLTFVLGLLVSLVAAFVFSMFIGNDPDFGFALGAGFSAGLFWVAGAFAINYLFERKPITLFLINGGFHTIQFTLYGLILGVL